MQEFLDHKQLCPTQSESPTCLVSFESGYSEGHRVVCTCCWRHYALAPNPMAGSQSAAGLRVVHISLVVLTDLDKHEARHTHTWLCKQITI